LDAIGGSGKSEDGDQCVFPFKYGGLTYNECTNIDHTEPWCYTTETGSRWAECDCSGEAPEENLIEMQVMNCKELVDAVNIEERYDDDGSPVITEEAWTAVGNCLPADAFKKYDLDEDGVITYLDCELIDASMMADLGKLAAEDRCGGDVGTDDAGAPAE